MTVRCVLVSLVCVSFVSLASATFESDDFDIQSHELTEEIKQLTQRPHPYYQTPPGYFPCTDVSPPEHYYEEEYKDKPCQDKAEWKIRAGPGRKVFGRKPKVIVDKLKVAKVNGEYQVQQEIESKGEHILFGDNVKDVKGDDVQINPIGDNLKANDEENIPKEEKDEAKPIGDNVEDVKGNGIQNYPIGDNLKAKDEENIPREEQKEAKPIGDNIEDVKGNGVQNNPIGDKLKVNTEEKMPKEERKKANPIGDNVKYHVDGVSNNEVDKEQVNMKDAVDAVKEETLDPKKKEADQRLFALMNAMNPAMNMRNLYNIAEETDPNNQNAKGENNAQNLIDDKVIDKLEGAKRNPNVKQEKMKICNDCHKPINDIKIKIKLETLDEPKAKDSVNGLNSLFDFGRKSLGGLNQFQSMVNKIMPLAQNFFSQNDKFKPQNFYMKYLQIDPSADGLKYQYYYFQKYVESRFGSPESGNEAVKPNLLISKVLDQMLGPMSPLTLLKPLTQSQNLPIKIFMNEKSAAKYAANLNRMEQVKSRGKRAADKTTTERPLFNEGPFKVEHPDHLAWAKDFLKEFPKDKRPTTYHVIYQQPSSVHPLQWYHAMPGEPHTYYTIVPTVTRTTWPGEPVDLCLCCNNVTNPTPATHPDDLIFKVGDKDPFYPESGDQ